MMTPSGHKKMISDTLLEDLQEALHRGGDEHSLQDVADMVTEGDSQLWTTPNAIIITEVLDQPQHRVLHFWLAGGVLPDVVALSRQVMDWGRQQGCTRSTLHGRRGWLRALRDEGWQAQGVIMGREL